MSVCDFLINESTESENTLKGHAKLHKRPEAPQQCSAQSLHTLP